jgi:hypothetical protein
LVIKRCPFHFANKTEASSLIGLRTRRAKRIGVRVAFRRHDLSTVTKLLAGCRKNPSRDNATERVRPRHYASFRSHDAVIRVYDAAGNVIETREYAGDFTAP